MIVKMNNKFRNMYVYMCIYLDIIKIVKTLYIDSLVFDYLISKTMLIVFSDFSYANLIAQIDSYLYS